MEEISSKEGRINCIMTETMEISIRLNLDIILGLKTMLAAKCKARHGAKQDLGSYITTSTSIYLPLYGNYLVMTGKEAVVLIRHFEIPACYLILEISISY